MAKREGRLMVCVRWGEGGGGYWRERDDDGVLRSLHLGVGRRRGDCNADEIAAPSNLLLDGQPEFPADACRAQYGKRG